MRRSATVIGAAALLVACTSTQPPPDPAPEAPRSDDAEPAAQALAPLSLVADHVVLEITANGGMPLPPKPGEPMPDYGPKVIAEIRWDGQATWSDDRLHGGPPLHEGSVDTARLRAFIDTLRSDGTLADAALNRTNLGPDAAFVTIRIDIGQQQLEMKSWHELVDPSKSIATAAGIVGLRGRDPKAVMAAEPQDYRHFIERWESIRSAVDGLLPSAPR